MAENYAYKYARLRLDLGGRCIELIDGSDMILDPLHIPIKDDSINYILKYYYPIPETVTSHDDFQGLWYLDAEHTQLFDEGNV